MEDPGLEGSASGASCADCGTPVPEESVNTQGAERTKCRKCGSTRRNYRMAVGAGHYSYTGNSVSMSVVRYPEVLLGEATRLFENDEYGVAVIVAHTACEVAVERIVAQSFSANSNAEVGEAVDALISGYNLSNRKIRKLFVALTGKNVFKDNEKIWPEFKSSAERRNQIVHKGTQPTEDEAQRSLASVRELINYLVPLIR